MYLIREEDIKKWRALQRFAALYSVPVDLPIPVHPEACMTSSRTGSKRLETKHIIENLKKINPYVENNIFKSVQNVNLETIIAYKDKNGTHNFLDRY